MMLKETQMSQNVFILWKLSEKLSQAPYHKKYPITTEKMQIHNLQLRATIKVERGLMKYIFFQF